MTRKPATRPDSGSHLTSSDAVAPSADLLDDDEPARVQRGIQSVEVGGQLLLALGRSEGRPMTLRDLARDANMSPSKAHPYLVSFGKLGMVEQDLGTGRYQLGPTMLRLGLVCLQRVDAVAAATPIIAALASEIEYTLAIAVWGNLGPTVIRIFESPRPIHVNMRAGTVMALAGTATGRAFAAWMAPKRVELMLAAGSSRSDVVGSIHDQMAAQDWPAFQRELDAIRQAGYASTIGKPIPGVNAISAPVFDHAGEIVLAITALGPADSFPTHAHADLTLKVCNAAADISHRLGYKA